MQACRAFAQAVILSLCGLVLLGMSVPASARAESLATVEVGDGRVHLRAGPGRGNRSLDRLASGTAVRVLEQRGPWARIGRSDTGKTGWIHTDYLRGGPFPDVCVDSPMVAFNRYLAASAVHARGTGGDRARRQDGAIKAMSFRGARHGIYSHSLDSLFRALERYGARPAIAIYHQEAAWFCHWLILPDRSFEYERIRIPAARSAAFVHDFRRALLKGFDQPARAPRRRGQPAAAATEGPDVDAVAAGRRLSHLLQIDRVLEHRSRIDRLIVVPHGIFGLVPFALLRGSFDPDPLGLKMSLSIGPNISEIGMGRGLHQSALFQPGQRARALVVGNPRYDDGEWVFPDLPGAAAEAVSVAERLETVPLTGAAAGLEPLLGRSDAVEILYLATHAVPPDPRDERPYGFLALADGDRLKANELSRLNLAKGALVVLSACQTGVGDVLPGGMRSLARSFQIEGAGSVLMSLWNVDDAATEHLMRRFVQHWSEGAEAGSAAGALRRAMADTRRRYPNPAQWAGFAVFGVEN